MPVKQKLNIVSCCGTVVVVMELLCVFENLMGLTLPAE